MSNWTITASGVLPPPGALLDVITAGGDQRQLRFKDGLWWLPDMAMYCYFVPTHWREAAS